MRRNRGYNNPQQSSDGPLLTTHLRDLDIELELLKRKRDIIQQEQDMLNRFESERQYDYGQSSKSYNRGEPNNYQFSTNDYSNRYDSPSRSGNFTIPQGTKRQTPNQYWAPPTTNKNFTTAPRINPWQTSIPKQNTGYTAPKTFQSQQSHPRNVSNPIRPLMSIQPSMSQRVQKKLPPRKDFKPSKVSKPKPHQAPNKLATYSKDVAKSLVSKVVDTNVNKKADFSQILRADKTPTGPMKGRMELALGSILKDVKSEHSTTIGDLEYFNASFVQRLIKHTIRTRIRNVMLDQVVGNVSDIVANYRKKYPKNTDIDLVQIAKDAQGLSTKTIGLTQLIESDNPEEFYKKNMAKTLTTKLEEMFQNLEKLYMNKGNDLEELAKNIPDPKNIANEQNKTEDKGANNADKQKDNTENVEDDDVVIVEPVCEQFSKMKYYKDFMDELIEARLPKILPKFKDMLQSIMLMDREFLGKQFLIVTESKKRTRYIDPNQHIVDKANQEQSTKPNDTSNSNESTTATESTTIISSETTSEPTKESSITSTPKKSEPANNIVSSPKSSPLPENASVIQSKVPTKDKVPASAKTPASSELYYVKLISRPTLPARAVIYDFLNQFNPTSIKKHKTISNLLVIGFKNIEDYNKVLTVNESVVGNATIVIKASENQVSKPKEATPSESDSNEKVLNTSNQSLLNSSFIDSDLENQITDLLTSIRKSEEEQSNENKISSDNAPKTDVDCVSNEPNNDEDITDQELNTDSTTAENVNTGDKASIDNEKSKQEAVENANATDKGDTQNTNNYIDSNRDDNSKEEDANQKELKTIAEDTEKNDFDKDINSKADTQNTYNYIDSNKDDNSKEEDANQKELETIAEDTEKNDFDKDINSKADDKIKDNLKEYGRSTPTRSSSRLANVTPSTIRTRRASRTQNN